MKPARRRDGTMLNNVCVRSSKPPASAIQPIIWFEVIPYLWVAAVFSLYFHSDARFFQFLTLLYPCFTEHGYFRRKLHLLRQILVLSSRRINRKIILFFFCTEINLVQFVHLIPNLVFLSFRFVASTFKQISFRDLSRLILRSKHSAVLEFSANEREFDRRIFLSSI